MLREHRDSRGELLSDNRPGKRLVVLGFASWNCRCRRLVLSKLSVFLRPPPAHRERRAATDNEGNSRDAELHSLPLINQRGWGGTEDGI